MALPLVIPGKLLVQYNGRNKWLSFPVRQASLPEVNRAFPERQACRLPITSIRLGGPSLEYSHCGVVVAMITFVQMGPSD